MANQNKPIITDKFVTFCCAVFIVILELCALAKGINGIALSLAVCGLAGLGGYTVRNIFKQ